MKKRAAFVSLLLLTLMMSVAQAQGFGKNKVNYSQQEWKTIRSEHFEVYFPEGSVWLARFTAQWAEDALGQIEEAWDYELEDRIPLIIYNSHNTFSETNVIGGRISEGTGGFTEFTRSRVVIPYEGSYEQMRHVIHHELVHALQYDMFMDGSFKSLALSRLISLPLWTVEGLAEFESMGWDIGADNVMRDATISDYAPPIDRMLGGVFAYKGGQALYRYLALTYGRDKIGRFIKSLKHTASVEKSLRAVFGVTLESLEKDWKTWLKREYWPEIAERKSPGEFSRQMTEHLEDGSFLNVGARISPDGKRIAYISTKRGFADVYLMDARTRKVERVIEGQQSPEFESLFLLRPGLAWSPDGQYLAIVAKRHGRNTLYLFDVKEREIEREFVFELDAMFTPAWNPKRNELTLVGLKDGWSDLYTVRFPDGDLIRLTHDPYDERNPDWSPDGATLVFSSDRPGESVVYEEDDPFDFGPYHLFAMEVASRSLRQLTDHAAKDEYPAWSPDGSQILFVSERSGIGNMYLLDVQSRDATPVTDSLTGAQQLDWSPDGSLVSFSAFQEGGYDIFLMDDPREIAGDLNPSKTELARRLFDPPVITVEATAETPQENDGFARHLEEELREESDVETRQWPRVVGIPELSDIEPKSKETSDSENGEDDAKSTENATANESPADPPRRKYTRPRDYKPRMTVESFGVQTQVSSFLGFSGQAYLSMSDLLGNQRLLFVTDQSISSIKNMNALVQYVHLYDRLNYGVTAFHTRDFFLANGSSNYNEVVLVADRNLGFRAIAEYPFSPFARLEGSLGYQLIQRDRVGIRIYDYYRVGPFGEAVQEVDEEPIDRKSMFPFELAYVEDTVGYGAFGPVDGQRLRLSFFTSPGADERFLRFGTLRADYRRYLRLADTQSLAVRLAGGTSVGANSQKFFLGGVETEISPRISSVVDDALRADQIFFPSFEGPLRGADLYEFVGDSFLLTNLEWRFQFIDTLSIGWPLPMTFRHIGGSLFADIGSTFDVGSSDEQDPNRLDSIDDFIGGVGFGSRLHLGIFILRFDAAWRVSERRIADDPRYYWSIGADF